MKQILPQILSKQGNGLMKVLLLALGLSMGLVLIAKVYYERVYDNFMDDSELVYKVMSNYKNSDGERSYSQTSGAIAPGIKAYCPSVEFATRTTGAVSDIDLCLIDKNGMHSKDRCRAKKMILADSSFFDIFTVKYKGNNPRESLNIESHIYISDSFAEKLSGGKISNLIGSMITAANMGDGAPNFVIDGIFADFPENSSFSQTDVIVSLPSISIFSWDGTNNWIGNDRYSSYVKLFRGSSASDVDKGIVTMCEKNLPKEQMEKAGIKIGYYLVSLSNFNIKQSEVARVCALLLIMAAAVLMVSIFNYVLIAISAMVHKSKMVAVRKCYGASPSNIYRMVFSETFVHLFVSLLISCLILYLLRNNIQQVIGASLDGMISVGSIVVLSVVCFMVFGFCGWLPGAVYVKVPVAAAFRGYKANSRKWSLVLLSLQFAMSAFFVSILLVIVLQYNNMINSDAGYSYKNIGIVYLDNQYKTKKDFIKDNIAHLPFVETTSCCANLPIHLQSGNNISVPGSERENFNAADMYFASNGYMKLFEIPIIDGSNFTEDPSITNEIMVSRSFVKKMEQMEGWTDGAVGKAVLITEHSNGPNDIFTICGVYDDYLIGSYEGQDTRPSIQFYGGDSMESTNAYMSMDWLLIKFKEITPENIASVNKIIKEAYPDGNEHVTLYSNEVVDMYKKSLEVKNSIAIAGVIVLLITLIGLIGYTEDEINRRRSEIAMRKINGASLLEILKLFYTNVLKIAIPAVIVGGIGAYFASESMLKLYTKKIELSWWIFASSLFLILLLISVVILVKTYNAANANPIKNIRTN